VNRRYGPFTSVRHVLQQRAVTLPDEVRAELTELALAGEAGEDEVKQMPSTDDPGKCPPGQGHEDSPPDG
jgi:hypothetical protein